MQRNLASCFFLLRYLAIFYHFSLGRALPGRIAKSYNDLFKLSTAFAMKLSNSRSPRAIKN
jgi:hypothetical protein